jgi:hypothetical protein
MPLTPRATLATETDVKGITGNEAPWTPEDDTWATGREETKEVNTSISEGLDWSQLWWAPDRTANF